MVRTIFSTMIKENFQTYLPQIARITFNCPPWFEKFYKWGHRIPCVETLKIFWRTFTDFSPIFFYFHGLSRIFTDFHGLAWKRYYFTDIHAKTMSYENCIWSRPNMFLIISFSCILRPIFHIIDGYNWRKYCP